MNVNALVDGGFGGGVAVPAVCLLCGIVSDSAWGDVCLTGGDVFHLLGNHP